jgi:excinuclease UvrABC ATPase subunit
MKIKLCFVNIYTLEHLFSEYIYITMFADLIFSVGNGKIPFSRFKSTLSHGEKSRSKLKNQVKSPFPWLNHG